MDPEETIPKPKVETRGTFIDWNGYRLFDGFIPVPPFDVYAVFVSREIGMCWQCKVGRTY